MNAIASIRPSATASSLLARAGWLQAVAICTFIAMTGPAVAGPASRGPRDILGIWVQYPFTLTFDPTLKRGDPQRVQLKPEYDARYKARLAAVAKGEAEGKPLANSSSQCLPVGMPSDTMGFAPFEIVSAKKMIFIFPEGWDPARRIYMDGRPIPPLDDLEPTFAGFSVGHWEGNTLVVDTAGIKPTAMLEEVPHSAELRVNERIRVLDQHTLEIVFTLTDPLVFNAPWVITKLYKDFATLPPGHLPGDSAAKPDTADKHGEHPVNQGAPLQVNEVVCSENNRNLPGADNVIGYELGK